MRSTHVRVLQGVLLIGVSLWFCLLPEIPLMAQELGTAQFELIPPNPTSQDQISIRLFGEWPDSCVPSNPQVSILNHQIEIDTFIYGEICLHVITPWELTVEIGLLESGEYDAVATSTANPSPPGSKTVIGRTHFRVKDVDTKISDSAYALLRERVSANRETFYVYQDIDSGFNHGFPSGFFGVIGKIDLDAACIDDPASAIGCSENLDMLDHERGTVLRITFDPLVSGEFAGLNIEEPQNFSGRPRGIGYNLTGASHILFEARSPTGLSLQFGLGNRVTDFLQLPPNPDFETICVSLVSPGGLNCPSYADITLDLGSVPGLADLHLLLTVVTNNFNAPEGGTILLDNIRFEPLPNSQETALGFPLSTQTFGVVPRRTEDQGRVPFPPDQVNRNVTTIYESALALPALIKRGAGKDIADARLIADAFNYALYRDNQGDPLPLAPDGSLGLHNGYESGDITLHNDQGPGAGRKREVRLAGFSAGTTLCGPSGFCLVQDGATGGNNAFAIMSLLAAYQEFKEDRYLEDARVIGYWIVGNLRDISGTGYGGYYLGYPDKGITPKPLLTGKSVENNADIFTAFMALAAVEEQLGNAAAALEWIDRAQKAGDFVMKMFDQTSGRFHAGTVPVGTPPEPGMDPSGPRRGEEVINIFDFLDANTFTTLALAAFPRYREQIDWRRPIQYALDNFAVSLQASSREFMGFGLVKQPWVGPTGIAWEFTGQMIVAMRFVDRLYGDSRFRDAADIYLVQIHQAQAHGPFSDGQGLLAATLQDGDLLPPIEHCLSTPFQCIPQRVGLAATTWAIFAAGVINPLLPDVIDSDRDGLSDHDEILKFGTHPQVADSDGDGLSDGTELGDSMHDADPETTTDPLGADSDDDGIPDGVEDGNHNGFVDFWETDPADGNSVPAFIVSLSKGFNLIGIHAAGEFRYWMPTLGDDGDIEKVMAYNDEADSFVTLIPGDISDENFTLDGAKGLMVYAKRDKAIGFNSLRCFPMNLKTGINLVAFGCLPSGYTAFQLLNDFGDETNVSIQRYSSENGAFETAGFAEKEELTGVDFPILPGEGYFVFTKEDVFDFRF